MRAPTASSPQPADRPEDRQTRQQGWKLVIGFEGKGDEEALVLEASRQAFPKAPALTPNAVKAILQYTALPVTDAQGKPAHWVQEGETLWGLSRRYRAPLASLLELNPALSQRVARVGADRALRAGDLLTLPGTTVQASAPH